MSQQLTLFDSVTNFSVRFTTSTQTQDWPLPVARELVEAIDATRAYGVFLMFSQGVFWDTSWDDEDATIFTGIDLHGLPVMLKLHTAVTYTDHAGAPL